MAKRPVVLVHGYSDDSRSYDRWLDHLNAAGYDATSVHLGEYVSLSNEVTIKDIAEGLDQALRASSLKDGQPFDAVVHSTGMLVVREWLAGTSCMPTRPEVAIERQGRLKHLIGLAPATFGSPMAHKGRSWLGAVFKGSKSFGPDFMEAGDQVLRALELGSAYTWDLAHRDFLTDTAVYGRSASTPYPFIFTGLKDYGRLQRLVTESGTDGTVRLAGTGFNTRKVNVDLTVEPTRRKRITLEPWKNVDVPHVFLPMHNHGDILQAPDQALVRMVFEALDVESFSEYQNWTSRHRKASDTALQSSKTHRWQQFVVRTTDERGDGIPDYFVEIGTIVGQRFKRIPAFDVDVHKYREDNSYRCFHVDLDRLKPDRLTSLALRVIASTGTKYVGYEGYSSRDDLVLANGRKDEWDAVIEFDPNLLGKDTSFFYPFTTTLVELMMNREPTPGGGIFRFVQR